MREDPRPRLRLFLQVQAKPRLWRSAGDAKAPPTKKSAHVERWLMFARDLYLKNKIKMALVVTDDMMGDNMTKVVDRSKFFKCRNYQMNE